MVPILPVNRMEPLKSQRSLLFERKETRMKLLALLKAKALITVVAGFLLVGGATAAFAATPTGQTVVQSIAHGKSTVTTTTIPDGRNTATPQTDQGKPACPGLSEAQQLATSYHLSTESKNNAIQAICALHAGTFKGTTTSGTAMSVSRAYGYGEVGQLLTYAQYLAAHDTTNAGGKLTDDNVSAYLANALHSCGTSPLEKCLRTNIPGYHSGNGTQPTATGTPDSKPTSTPGGKPTGTPGSKPTSTPTPHN